MNFFSSCVFVRRLRSILGGTGGYGSRSRINVGRILLLEDLVVHLLSWSKYM